MVGGGVWGGGVGCGSGRVGGGGVVLRSKRCLIVCS